MMLASFPVFRSLVYVDNNTQKQKCIVSMQTEKKKKLGRPGNKASTRSSEWGSEN